MTEYLMHNKHHKHAYKMLNKAESLLEKYQQESAALDISDETSLFRKLRNEIVINMLKEIQTFKDE